MVKYRNNDCSGVVTIVTRFGTADQFWFDKLFNMLFVVATQIMISFHSMVPNRISHSSMEEETNYRGKGSCQASTQISFIRQGRRFDADSSSVCFASGIHGSRCILGDACAGCNSFLVC